MSKNSHYSEPGTITYTVFYWDNNDKDVRIEEFDEDRKQEAHEYATDIIQRGIASQSHVKKCEYINSYMGEIKINKRF